MRKGRILPFTKRWATLQGIIKDRWGIVPDKEARTKVAILVKQRDYEEVASIMSSFYGIPQPKTVTAQHFYDTLKGKGMLDTDYGDQAKGLLHMTEELWVARAMPAYEAHIYPFPAIILSNEAQGIPDVWVHEFIHLVEHYQPHPLKKSEEEVVEMHTKFFRDIPELNGKDELKAKLKHLKEGKKPN